MSIKIEILLSSTGKDSHKYPLPIGRGYLHIGTEGMDKKQFDMLVDLKKPIIWDASNNQYIGH